MGIKEAWKMKWAKEQSLHSIHPVTFWLEIAEFCFQNRAVKKMDLFRPLGSYENNWDVFGFLVSINNVGIEIEKTKGMEAAFVVYEVGVAEQFHGTHPYDRLRIWYTKNKNFADAKRVCRAYISLPSRAHGQAKDRFSHFLKKLEEKIDKQGR